MERARTNTRTHGFFFIIELTFIYIAVFILDSLILLHLTKEKENKKNSLNVANACHNEQVIHMSTKNVQYTHTCRKRDEKMTCVRVDVYQHTHTNIPTDTRNRFKVNFAHNELVCDTVNSYIVLSHTKMV